MHHFAIYLIYISVVARAIGWNHETEQIPNLIWILLIIFGVILISEQSITHRFPLYPRLYTLTQSALVIAMLYGAPTLDFIPMLFFPLSFQAVHFFHSLVGFVWITGFILATSGMFLFGMEWQAGVTMVLAGGGANLLMGSYAHLIECTEQRHLDNRRLFGDLQEAYHQLRDSAVQVEVLAAVTERHRLARELHDSLTQTLFSMNLAVQSAQLSIQEDPLQTEGYLNHLQNLTRSAVSEVQTITRQTPSRSLPQGDLASTIQYLAEERLVQDGLRVTLEITGQRSLPEFVEINLYRIAQEALNNITRHAGVYQAQVRLHLISPVASLEVVDKGCGFNLAESKGGRGFGLTGMAERASEIGWALEIKSYPGKGTHIRVSKKVT